MKNTFIYALCEPGTRTVRYIGKANNPEKRLRGHLSASVKLKTRLGNWLRSLNNKSPELIRLREVPVEQWEMAEERYIRLARGCGMNLVNSTDGGDGGNIPGAYTLEANAKRNASNTGKKHTPEARAKMSEARKGKLHSPETRAKLSVAAFHAIKIRTPEARAKMSEARKGKKQPPEQVLKRAASHRGKKRSLEARANISAGIRAARLAKGAK